MHVRSLERTEGSLLHARLQVDVPEPMIVEAVDWELVQANAVLVRGRSESLDLWIAYSPELARDVEAGAEIELRGAVHLRAGSRWHLASFAELVSVR